MLFWIKTWRKKTRNVLLFYDGALFRQRWRNPYVNWSYKPTKSITSHVSTFTVTRPAFRCLLCPEWIVNSFSTKLPDHCAVAMSTKNVKIGYLMETGVVILEVKDLFFLNADVNPVWRNDRLSVWRLPAFTLLPFLLAHVRLGRGPVRGFLFQVLESWRSKWMWVYLQKRVTCLCQILGHGHDSPNMYRPNWGKKIK